MKSDPNKTIGGEFTQIGELSQRLGGLTLREYYAIEVYKSLVATGKYSSQDCAGFAHRQSVLVADELIFLLNKENV